MESTGFSKLLLGHFLLVHHGMIGPIYICLVIQPLPMNAIKRTEDNLIIRFTHNISNNRHKLAR